MEIKFGFKLFEKNEHGQLFPLFIDKSNPIPIGEWIKAKYIPTKGYAKRGGWHIGTVPDAPWLKGYDGSDCGCYKSRFKHGERVWCIVQYNANNNYDKVVSQLPKKCISDGVPEDGFYTFREAGKGKWIIASDMKIVAEIDETIRMSLLNHMFYDEARHYQKYKQAFEKRMRIGAN